MEAIILAGGFGTRLRHVVPDLPKPMAPVAGRPFLEILLSFLARENFHRVVLSLGYMADKVVEYFGDSFDGMELVFEIEDTPLGTGGALRRAMMHCIGDHVFVFNGDTYLDLAVKEVESHWHKHRVPIIVACQVSDAARYGRLSVGHGRVSGFAEKGMSGPGLINAGCYVLPVDIFKDFFPEASFSLEKDFLEKAVAEQRFDVFVANGRFIDIGLPEDYARAQIELANDGYK
jgi:D-glycero-alpha-D-manno-heptose 1-phosphate guanylyltransferase